jgi:para-aminobenzoate synthetase component II
VSKTVLVIDNFDSFVYNLVQYVGELGAEVVVVRSNEVELESLTPENYAGVLISPGPGHPRDVEILGQVIDRCEMLAIPLLGVCLGHQAMGLASGSQVVSAPSLVHGRATEIEHDGKGIFTGLASPLRVGRYHSLVVDHVPEGYEVSATGDGLIMALRHTSLPFECVQFHPESILTEGGHRMIANWLSGLGITDALGRCDQAATALPTLESTSR